MGRMATTRERQRMGNGPVAYANRMASYNPDAKYIEAMTKREYDRSPSIEDIKVMQEKHRRQKEAFARPRIADGYDEAADDGWHYAPRKTAKPIEDLPPALKPVLVSGRLARIPAFELVRLVGRDFGLTVEQMRDNSHKHAHLHARSVVVRILRDRGLQWGMITRALARPTDKGVPYSYDQFDNYAARDLRVSESYAKWKDI